MNGKKCFVTEKAFINIKIMSQTRLYPLDLETINRRQQCRSWYLADGRVRPAVSHHDVGVQVDVAQLHRGRAHHHRAAHLAADALRGACRGQRGGEGGVVTQKGTQKRIDLWWCSQDGTNPDQDIVN